MVGRPLDTPATEARACDGCGPDRETSTSSPRFPRGATIRKGLPDGVARVPFWPVGTDDGPAVTRLRRGAFFRQMRVAGASPVQAGTGGTQRP